MRTAAPAPDNQITLGETVQITSNILTRSTNEWNWANACVEEFLLTVEETFAIHDLVTTLFRRGELYQ